MSMNWTSFRKNFLHDDEAGARPRRVSVKSLYGFTDPPDFTRAIPFLAAILLLCLIAVAAGGEVWFGKMHWGTYRCAYFVYLGAAAVAGGALSFAPRAAWPLLAIAFIDLALGFSTAALVQLHFFERSILPSDVAAHEYQFHPLLQGAPTPNYLQLSPYRIQHDSYGLRGPERDKDRLKQQVVIAAVGGSTTYDVAVADGQTWPAVLEHDLGRDYAVLNHGVPVYSSAEHLIQTLFYLDAYDVTPRCAIYYVGWNDIHNAHLPNLDPGYADYYDFNKITLLQVRKTPLVAEISPLATIIVRYLQLWVDTVPPAPNLSRMAPVSGGDSRLENIYRRNLQAIAAINEKRGITSIFVAQVLNRARLHGAKTESWWPLVRDDDLWPLQARFNTILKETADAAGSPAFIPPIDQFQDSDFIDKGHFSEQGSRKFAAMLAPLVRANCQKNNRTEGRSE
jgi:lysophospholipase L1-like esterase